MNKRFIVDAIMILVFIIIFIVITYLLVPEELVETDGTLILAIIALFAVFYETIIKYIKRPIFDVKFESNNEEIRLKVTNNGMSTAHLCKVAIEVYNEDDTMIIPLFLPWDIQNDNVKIKVAAGPLDMPNCKEESLPVTYDGIVLYRQEYEFVKLFFSKVGVFSIYGYPYNEYSYDDPPLQACNGSGKGELEYSKNYKIKITVYCEEISQRSLKIICFNLEQTKVDKMCNYRFCVDKNELHWKIH